MSKTRYKIRKEQLERVVESFVTETAAPEAKKHIQGYNDKEDESLGMRTGKESTKKQSKKARRDDSLGKFGKRTKQAPEAKKHVKSKMTESEKINEVDPLTVGLGVAGLISLAGGAAAIEGYCNKLTDKQKKYIEDNNLLPEQSNLPNANKPLQKQAEDIYQGYLQIYNLIGEIPKNIKLPGQKSISVIKDFSSMRDGGIVDIFKMTRPLNAQR